MSDVPAGGVRFVQVGKGQIEFIEFPGCRPANQCLGLYCFQLSFPAGIHVFEQHYSVLDAITDGGLYRCSEFAVDRTDTNFIVGIY